MKPKKELVIPICRRKNPNMIEDWHIGWSSEYTEKEIEDFRDKSGLNFTERPSVNHTWTEQEGLLRNKEFIGPFEMIDTFSTMSTAGYRVRIELPNKEFVSANIKYDTLFDLMEKEVQGKIINCSLMFKKIGQSYFLHKFQ